MITSIDTGASREADFYPHGPEDAPPVCEQALPNPSGMGVVTLGPASSPKANDGEFICSRHLTQDELTVAWAEHNARHGKATP